jgi:hypothetical protein
MFCEQIQSTVYSGSMKLYNAFHLCFAQLVLCDHPPIVLEYNCTKDGLPTVVVVAGQGPSLPNVEFFVPMFSNCSAAMDRSTAFFQAGEWVVSCAFRVPFSQQTGFVFAQNIVPISASSFIATGIADHNGFTGSGQALQLQRFFPLELVRCVVLQRGVIKMFNSTVRTTTSGDGGAVAIDSIFCGR